MIKELEEKYLAQLSNMFSDFAKESDIELNELAHLTVGFRWSLYATKRSNDLSNLDKANSLLTFIRNMDELKNNLIHEVGYLIQNPDN